MSHVVHATCIRMPCQHRFGDKFSGSFKHRHRTVHLPHDTLTQLHLRHSIIRCVSLTKSLTQAQLSWTVTVAPAAAQPTFFHQLAFKFRIQVTIQEEKSQRR